MGASSKGEKSEKNDALIGIDGGSLHDSESPNTMSAWKAYWVCGAASIVLTFC